MFFLDANVFLYAAGSPHPLRGPCQNLIERVAHGSLPATTNAEVLQEILHVQGRKGRLNEAILLVTCLHLLLKEILPVTGTDVRAACEILHRHPGFAIRDAIHVATMRLNGIKAIISVDPDFDRIPDIQRIPPEKT